MTWLLPTVVRGFAEQKQFDTAWQTAASIAAPEQKAEALIAIASVYTTPNSQPQNGIQRWLNSLNSWLNSWLQGLFGKSDRERAIEALDQALQITQSLSSKE